MNRISIVVRTFVVVLGSTLFAGCPALQDAKIPCDSHLDCPTDFSCDSTNFCKRGLAESALTVEPSKIAIGVGTTTSFTAKIDGRVTKDVTWSLEGSGAGLIDGNGTYAAPAELAVSARVKVWATFKSRPEAKASAIVTVQPPDKTVGWVMSYFENGSLPKQVKQDSLHLAYSRDGLAWTPFALTGGPSFQLTGLGSNHLRDPFIMRKRDGTFVLLATDFTRTTSSADYWSTPSPNIIVADSTDLITFTNQRLLPVSSQNLSNGSPMHAWGPEAFYDPDLDQYAIIWAGNDVNDVNRIYVTYTKDFQKPVNETPTLFFDPGYSVVDATLVQTDNYNYLVFKDERASGPGASTGKDIQIARSTSLTPGSFTLLGSDYITRGKDQATQLGAEGPFLVWQAEHLTWLLCADFAAAGGAGCWSTPDLNASPGSWTRLASTDYTLPAAMQHANAVRVTGPELDALIAHKGGAKTVRILSQYLDMNPNIDPRPPLYLAQSLNLGIFTYEADKNAGQVAADFVFDLWPGLIRTGDPGFVSIANASITGRWLRASSANPNRWPGSESSGANRASFRVQMPASSKNHLTFLDPYDSSTTFARDATFKIVQPAVNGDASLVSLLWCGDTQDGTCDDISSAKSRYLCISYFHAFASLTTDKCVGDPIHFESADTLKAMSFTLVPYP